MTGQYQTPTLRERLTRVETKLDSIMEYLTGLPPLEKRVSELERWRAYLIGGSALLGACLTWLLTWLTRPHGP